MQYPVSFRVSRAFLSELYMCESGRHEDAQRAREEGDEESIRENNYELVACDFLDRYKTIIRIENDAELVELYYALASGTIGVMGYTRAANNLLDKIRDRVREVNPKMVEDWPFQNGA